MNILSDKPIKLVYNLPGNTNLEVDYIVNGRSIFNDYDYTQANIEIKSVEYIVNIEEIKYFKKNKCKVSEVLRGIPNTNSISEYFTLARVLQVNVQDIITKNVQVLTTAYRKKLLSFLKNSYCKKHFSSKMESDILAINDASILLQYLPLDTFYRDNNLSKKYNHIHNIRVKLYYILFPDQQEFIELFDREFIWATECLNAFKIPDLTFAKFSLENETIMKPMRELWGKLIFETYERAKSLLREEELSATKFNDVETLQEIELIKKELDKTINEVNLDVFKTPKALLRYWPDIFAPGPSLLYPY